MTQEQIVRGMLRGFIQDPPDSEHQEGFLDGIRIIALEVMGFDWDDPLFQMLDEKQPRDKDKRDAASAKARATFTIIDGGKVST